MITLANAIGVAMYVIGFCESFLDMLYEYSEFRGISKFNYNQTDLRKLYIEGFINECVVFYKLAALINVLTMFA